MYVKTALPNGFSQYLACPRWLICTVSRVHLPASREELQKFSEFLLCQLSLFYESLQKWTLKIARMVRYDECNPYSVDHANMASLLSRSLESRVRECAYRIFRRDIRQAAHIFRRKRECERSQIRLALLEYLPLSHLQDRAQWLPWCF